MEMMRDGGVYDEGRDSGNQERAVFQSVRLLYQICSFR